MSDIIDRLIELDDAYEMGEPLVSDFTYDMMKSNARTAHPDHPYFSTVGSSVRGDKVKLPVVLGSLSKVKPDGSFQKWVDDHQGDKVYWAKLDGVSALVRYVDGKYHSAFTRGNGEYGTNITSKLVNSIPSQLMIGGNPIKTNAMYRAEVMLVGDVHRKLDYKTRRNGAAGILNRDTNEYDCHLKVVFYEVIEDSSAVALETEYCRIMRMGEVGLPIAPYVVGNLSQDDVIELLIKMKTENDFDIDGVVITLDDVVREDVFYPENKVAFKQNEESIPVKVVDVEWSVGRTGRVVPTVLIEPTVIQGVTIERATGFNAKYVQDNKITFGTVVRVVRSGDCIPYIDSVD